jgi:hypothetical protein
MVELQEGRFDAAKGQLEQARERGERVDLNSDLKIGLEIWRLEANSEGGVVPVLSRAEYRRLRNGALGLDPRTYQSVLALRLLGLSGAKGSSAADDVRNELAAAVKQYAGCGWQDFPVSVLASSYSEIGERRMARSILLRYLVYDRAERGRLRPRLEALADTLAIKARCHALREQVDLP